MAGEDLGGLIGDLHGNFWELEKAGFPLLRIYCSLTKSTLMMSFHENRTIPRIRYYCPAWSLMIPQGHLDKNMLEDPSITEFIFLILLRYTKNPLEQISAFTYVKFSARFHFNSSCQFLEANFLKL